LFSGVLRTPTRSEGLPMGRVPNVLAAASLVAAAACVTQKPVPTPAPVAAEKAPPVPAGPARVEKTLAEVGLDASALDRSANPCTDFYQFACGGWLERTEIPADKSRWGRSFAEIDKRNEAELRRILDAAAAGSAADPVTQKLGTYYGACMDEATIEAAGVKPVEPLLKLAREVKDKSTLMKAVVELHRHRVWALFDISAEQDFKDATQVVAYLDQNGLGLPDRDYYVNDDPKTKEIRTKYFEHVQRMFKLAGVPAKQAENAAASVMNLETALARASKTRVERRDPAGLYNKRTRAELAKEFPTVPWDAYFAALGRPDLTQAVLTSPAFFAAVDKELRSGKPEDWRWYLQWTVLRSAASGLPKAFVDEAFAMSSALSGQQQLEDRWKRCVDSTDGALGELLAQPWLETMFAGSSREATQTYVAQISKAFGAGLERLDWMDAPTREKAAAKLKSMVYKIGFPAKWKAYDFPVDRKSHAANVLASRAYEMQRDLAKIGKPVDREEWLMSPPTVNAYYNPLKNEMVFPAGILQPPFFNVNADVPVNLGGMGMVVGHELTHGFDDEGSKFAADGNLQDWWDPKVAEAFQARTQCVADQYSKYVAVPASSANGQELPAVTLDGKLTLGENIADIGGVKLAFSAYRQLRRDAKEAVVAEGFTEDQQFFLAVGQAWCTKAREQVARMLAKVDPHSPPKFRVNGSLANTPEFGEAFRCEPGSPMRPTNACAVW
jgi:putative endopeptidase